MGLVCAAIDGVASDHHIGRENTALEDFVVNAPPAPTPSLEGVADLDRSTTPGDRPTPALTGSHTPFTVATLLGAAALLEACGGGGDGRRAPDPALLHQSAPIGIASSAFVWRPFRLNFTSINHLNSKGES